MKIKNLTRNIEVEAGIAATFWKRIFGLSFSNKNLLFEMPYSRNWGFWMFLVRVPIKIIFIDNQKQVIEITTALPITFSPKTWKIYKPKKPCKYVLELVDRSEIKVGDKLSF